MKTTNYEISKKLEEIGFEANAEYYFIKRGNQKAFLINIKELSDIELLNETGELIKSYDLKTLLKASPNFICHGIDFENGKIFYENSYTKNLNKMDGIKTVFYRKTEKGESLADTAGKLLIELFEAGIINFKK